jgi:SpoVK/Ycf46/Vps4 family AAA+-type ATPase
MVGPPGCGKTLMGRVAAAEIRRMTGVTCHFVVIKPAEWENEFVGATQRNIRNCFAAMNQATAADDFVLLFLDEVEAVGRLRGSVTGFHNDKFLAALLAELDGFTARGRVAIVAATNRKDLLDPALLERLSDLEISVQRPDMRAARDIFAVHLTERFPFSPNGEAAHDTRRELIDRAVSRMFAPNAENELCAVRFRDGKTRTVAARELASGRLIEQICRAARQTAFLREVQAGERGIRVADIDDAVADAIERLTTTLTPRNIRAYLNDLPQDIDVVSVEPIVRQTRRAHRYRTQT